MKRSGFSGNEAVGGLVNAQTGAIKEHSIARRQNG
jgi:hypothetical protein